MKTKFLFLAVSMTFAAASASAQSYVGASVGTMNAPSECGWLKPGNVGDCRSGALKLSIGYQLNKRLALELGYADLGHCDANLADGTKARAHLTAAELIGVFSVPLGNRFSAYGKAGVADGMSHATKNTNNTFVENNDTTAITFGFGAAYKLTRRDYIRADWQRYNMVGDATVLSVGFFHQF